MKKLILLFSIFIISCSSSNLFRYDYTVDPSKIYKTPLKQTFNAVHKAMASNGYHIEKIGKHDDGSVYIISTRYNIAIKATVKGSNEQTIVWLSSGIKHKTSQNGVDLSGEVFRFVDLYIN